ncbi:hypothetical protein GCM10023238_36490 [Streptomyces heliomycini]
MTMPIWTTARASAGFFFALAISCRTAHLAEGEVGGELAEVVLEAAAQVVGVEVLQHLVGGDELGHALPLGRVDGAVGGRHQAHIAMLASRKAPLFRSFFFATSWVCIVDADSLRRSHRAMSTPYLVGRAPGPTCSGRPVSSATP